MSKASIETDIRDYGLPKYSYQQVSVADALIAIQNDMFNCKSIMELGRTYKNYDDILKQFLIKGIEKITQEGSEENG